MDRKLDRIPHFDERSRNYPVRALVGATKPVAKVWPCTTWLNQGQEGACVGYSWAHELAAEPHPVKVRDQTAKTLYRAAQKLDEFPGEDYEGSSVLGGAKAVKGYALLTEYRWAFGLNDLVLAVGYQGPAVLGVNWYSRMFDTDSHGFVKVGGTLAGGHAILCLGVLPKDEYFVLHNSWGREWGQNGEARISFKDMNRLLREQGEACLPVKRRRSQQPTTEGALHRPRST